SLHDALPSSVRSAGSSDDDVRTRSGEAAASLSPVLLARAAGASPRAKLSARARGRAARRGCLRGAADLGHLEDGGQSKALGVVFALPPLVLAGAARAEHDRDLFSRRRLDLDGDQPVRLAVGAKHGLSQLSGLPPWL